MKDIGSIYVLNIEVTPSFDRTLCKGRPPLKAKIHPQIERPYGTGTTVFPILLIFRLLIALSVFLQGKSPLLQWSNESPVYQ